VTTCSQDARAAHEPLPGTAPYATAWIVVEQPGAWGRDALNDSNLDPTVARHLVTAKGTGVSVILARHPDRPPRADLKGRHVWLARSYAGATLLRHAVVDSLDQLLDWDFTAIGSGQLPAFGSVRPAPMMFVCTNSGRDLCCATAGRALVGSLMNQLPVDARTDVWECSHIGGHRFAPVALSLPTGVVHGRLDLDTAMAVRRRARDGRTVLEKARGRSSLPQPLQVAVIEVQRRFDVEEIDDLDALVVRGVAARPTTPASVAALSAERSVEVEVRHADGRAWGATVLARALDRDRLESCGKEPVPGMTWSCVRLDTAPNWR
jgi:hypothetical protein